MLSARTQLPADPSAPALARAFVTTEVDRHFEQHVDDLVLIVSELVTNAVRAGSRQIELVISADEHGLELSIVDDAAGFPIPRPVTPDSLGGRGLHIVEALADSWHAGPLEDGRGKRVTARWQTTQAAVAT